MLQSIWFKLSYAALALTIATTAKALDTNRFAALKERIETRGSRLRTPDMVIANLVRVQPDDLQGPHRTFAVSEIDSADDQKFRARLFSLVNETWTFDAEQNWVIDQWIFEAYADGSLRRVSHYALVESPKRIVLKHDPLLVTTEISEDLERRFDQALEPWYTGEL